MLRFMKEKFNLVKKDSIIRLSFYVSLGFFLLQCLLIAFFFGKLPPFIPFMNSLVWGSERLVPSSIILSIPLVWLAIFCINYFSSIFIYKNHTLAARILSFNMLLFALLSLFANVQILLLVF